MSADARPGRDDYEIQPLDLSSRGVEAIAKLLRGVFPRATHLTPAYLDWLYRQNPDGPAVGTNACSGGEVVGHYVTIPMRARLFGNEVPGAHSLNGAVHPEYQGRGIYARLGFATHERNAAAGHRFLIGVPNQNSTHVFVRTFDFQWVCALEARLGVGRLAFDVPTDDVDYARVWDARVLRWRLANPSSRYQLSTRADRLEIRAPTGRPGIRALLGSIDAALLPERAALAGRARPGIDLWIGADPSIRWSRSLYWNLPRRLRPAPLNFVFKDLSGGSRKLAPHRLRYAALDFDAY